MPYDRLSELPPSVRGILPEHAQVIYRKAFNNAWEEYADRRRRRDDATREEVAHKVAWAAVKSVYEKSPEGRWRKRRRTGTE